MTETSDYTPPDVWVWEKDNSPNWRYGHLNRPIAGATHDRDVAARHTSVAALFVGDA